MIRYFRRDGTPYETFEEFLADKEERDAAELDNTVIQSRHKERGKDIWLSTVWLFGIDHGFLGGPPLLYETMAFEYKPTSWNAVIGELAMEGISQRRYTTEDQARTGHDPWEMT